MYRCAICDQPAVVGITGVIIGETHIDFEPPEYRCEMHQYEDADGAEVLTLDEETPCPVSA